MLRALDKWLVPYLRRKIPETDEAVDVIMAVCDHFEPLHHSDKAGAIRRIQTWVEKFPGIVNAYQDVDNQPPKHTFFYPVEQYDSDLLGPLAELCHRTKSEVEIHLHHDQASPEATEEALERGRIDLAKHGLLSEDELGAIRYAFIHGDWALNNSHPEGRGCGVEREIPILRQTGCYADFTMPSAPSSTQTRRVNTIAYACDLPGRRALDESEAARVDSELRRRDNTSELLMIPGSLALNWKHRKWGIIPRIENGDITGVNPPTMRRLQLAQNQRISVAGKPNWVFVKFHTHGGIEKNFDMLLGEPMRQFHESIANCKNIRVHYATAREMANMVHAAEDGCEGSPNDFRDYCFRLRA